MSRPVLIEYRKDVKPSPEAPSGHLKGERYRLASAADARKYHPDATITEWADTGERYAEPAATPAKASKKD